MGVPIGSKRRTGELLLSGSASVNVVIATIMRPAGNTGVQSHARLLHQGLARAGILSSVQTPFSGNKMWLPIFAVRPLLLRHLERSWSTRWYRHWHFVALRENLLRYLSRHPVDVVIALCTLSARAALEVRARLRADYKAVFVCHFNYSEAQEFRDKGELADDTTYRQILDLETQVMQCVDEVIHTSHWAKGVVEVERGIRPKSSQVIWNGIARAVPAPGLARKDLGLSSDDLILINVGTLESRKNQLGLIDLFTMVAARHPRARLLLVGDGPQRAAIRRKLDDKGLGSAVRLLGARSDVPALLGLADIYIHYASVENCPFALLEAARAGLPSAALPLGGIPEVQAHLQSGVSLDPDDLGRSLQALEPLLTNPLLRTEMGRLALQNFERAFTQDAMVAAYLKVLRLPRDE